MGGFKYEDYRQPWETGPHWELKREFMEKYCDMFAEDRLLCLAQAYANIVLMNCRYPDPVMTQISHLAKPLELRKKFQGITDSSEAEDPKKHEVAEKAKLIYEKAGKPFKQVIFCSSAKHVPPVESSQSSSLSENFIQEKPYTQSSSLHHMDSEPLAEKNSGQTAIISESNIESMNVENDETDLDTENTIIQSLGLEFIQIFVQKIRMLQVKLKGHIEVMMNAAQILKINNFLDFQYEFVPASKPSLPSEFICKFSIKKCFIASGKATNKKKAKLNSVADGLDILIKLASCVYPSTSSKSNVKSESCLLDQTANTVEKVTNINTMEKCHPKKPKSFPILQEDFKNLENLSRMFGDAIPDHSCVKVAASRLNIQKLISFKRTIVHTPHSKSKVTTWKLFYKHILISSGSGTKLQTAKFEALKSAYIKLKNLKNCEIQNNELCEKYPSDEMSLVTHSAGNAEVMGKKINVANAHFTLNRSMFYSSISDCFVLLNNLSNPHKNFRNTLSESAQFCKKLFGYNVVEVPGTEFPQYKADVLLNDILVGSGISTYKESAKTIACDNAIDMLRKRYYVLQTKNDYDDSFRITREYAFSNHGSASDALTDNNVGCKMLKSMGWTGGGLGSSGIAEPVGLDTVHNFGKGLGFAKKGDDCKVFKRQIHSLLRDFSRSESISDLLFSTDFTKQERKIIHQLAGNYGLNTVSRGKDKDRFIVIKRKYTVVEVLEHLEKLGGSDNKFQLVDASIDEQNPFKIISSI